MRKAFFCLLSVLCALAPGYIPHENYSGTFEGFFFGMSLIFVAATATTHPKDPNQTFFGQCKFCGLAALTILIITVLWHFGVIQWFGERWVPLVVAIFFGILATTPLVEESY